MQDSPINSPDPLPGSGGAALAARAAVAGAVLSGAAGCARMREEMRRFTGPTPPDPLPLPDDPAAATSARRVLERAAFGPRPGDIARTARMGPAAWLEEQLAGALGDDPAVRWRVEGLDTQQFEAEAPDVLFSMPDEQLLRETAQAALLRAIYSRWQLREVLADFWTNHFNIYALKLDGRVLIPTDTERVIRPHVLGRFRDMLLASARSPAMLVYLDNQMNRVGVANENYARELLELHTLGVDSGYTQRDIQETARCFTGWTISGGFARGQFTYQPRLHDDGPKHIPFLGLRLSAGGGQRDGEQVLERLAVHPATGRFLARKLCRRFLGAAPAPLVERAASAFARTEGDIKATLRPILLDGLAPGSGCAPILKRPLDVAVSALRALAADTDGGAALQDHLARMGQPLYQWPMPDGFPEKESAWTGSMLARWNFALALAEGRIAGTAVDYAELLPEGSAGGEGEVDLLLETILGRRADSPGLERLRAHAVGLSRGIAGRARVAALALASPPFQWKS